MGRLRFALWVVVALTAWPSSVRAQQAGESAYEDLASRARKAASSGPVEPLRQDVLALMRKYPGTPAAVKAAGLLRNLSSPLDKLDAKAIPVLERFDWHPKETVAVVGEHRGRQGGSVTSVLFSRSGKWVASGSTHGLVRIWDTATMRLRHSLGHGAAVYSLAATRDSGVLASSGSDGQVHLWDMTGKAPKDKGLLKLASTPLTGLALAPNGKTLVAGGSDTRVYLWDLAADPPKELAAANGHTGAVQATIFSPSGRLIASGADDKTIKVWTFERAGLSQKAMVEGSAGVLCLAWHPTEEKTLISGDAAGVIRIWDVGAKLKERTAIPTKYGAVNAVTFSGSGKTIAAAFADGTAHTWSYATSPKEKAILEGHKGAATSVAFATDGSFIATGGVDWTVRLWPGVSGLKPKDRTIAKGHLSHVYTVAFHPAGAALASGSYDATVRLWDLAAEPKERIAKLKEEGAIYTLAFAPDGKALAAGGAAAMFRTCEPDTGRYLYGFTGHAGSIARLAWSADGKQVASCSNDKTIRLWDGHTGKGKSAITAFEAPVNSVAFSPDSRQLLCTSGTYLYDKAGRHVTEDGEYIYNDSTVRLYEVDELKEVGRWKYKKVLMNCIAFTPDGRSFLAGGSDVLLREWDALKLPKEANVFFKGTSAGVNALACSPDGRWLASYGPDYRVQVFELATRKKVHDWAMGEQFGSLAFAADSRHLAVGVGTGVVLILRLAGPEKGPLR